MVNMCKLLRDWSDPSDVDFSFVLLCDGQRGMNNGTGAVLCTAEDIWCQAVEFRLIFVNNREPTARKPKLSSTNFDHVACDK